jgi:hypothetical protein
MVCPALNTTCLSQLHCVICVGIRPLRRPPVSEASCQHCQQPAPACLTAKRVRLAAQDLSGNGEEVLFKMDGEDLDMVEAIIHSHTRSKTSISLVIERPHPCMKHLKKVA